MTENEQRDFDLAMERLGVPVPDPEGWDTTPLTYGAWLDWLAHTGRGRQWVAANTESYSESPDLALIWLQRGSLQPPPYDEATRLANKVTRWAVWLRQLAFFELIVPREVSGLPFIGGSHFQIMKVPEREHHIQLPVPEVLSIEDYMSSSLPAPNSFTYDVEMFRREVTVYQVGSRRVRMEFFATRAVRLPGR